MKAEITSLKVSVRYWPRYKVVKAENHKSKSDVYVIMVQPKPRAGWRIATAENTALIYATEDKANMICRWLMDPKGTESEWNGMDEGRRTQDSANTTGEL